jgi:hypothetical protein
VVFGRVDQRAVHIPQHAFHFMLAAHRSPFTADTADAELHTPDSKISA